MTLPEPALVEATSAESNAPSLQIARSSPFPARKKATDPSRTAILAIAAIALLAFIGSMIAVLLMRAPGL